MTDNFLLEIGTEEIPAGYIGPALTAMSERLLQKLEEARIDNRGAKVMGTPRRLAVFVSDVADKQKSAVTEIMGPPEKVGYDEKGAPTVAAIKFAEKVGLSIDDITVRQTEKGAYLCATVTEEGRETFEVLEKVLPDIIKALPFPKTMRWAELKVTFARPIHSIVALLGDRVVPVEFGNITSGKTTSGHRFTHAGTVEISDADGYVESMRSAGVVVDLEERKGAIEKSVSEAASGMGGSLLQDDELLDIVTNLVEYPAVVSASFEEDFLALPDEVLINSMREHQKYFAVVDTENRLLPCFLTVSNTPARDLALVAKGNQRVLRARLADAKFFYESDLRCDLNDWVEKLSGVLFQAKLGSMREKVDRVRLIGETVCDALGVDAGSRKRVSDAARFSKADLVSEVVGEFPKLQGVMGRIYALKAGMEAETAVAVEEHYRPAYSGGPLPTTETGAVVAIADKIDSICGCFHVGLIPTGASDPYALRRQAIGVIQIILNRGFSCSLLDMIRTGVKLYAEAGKNPDKIEETVQAVYRFIENRFTYMLVEEGFSKDVVAAVTAVSVDNVPDVMKRARALEKLKALPDFDPLAVAFKRIVNILRKEGMTDQTGAAAEVDTGLFEDDSEHALFKACQAVEETVSRLLEADRFDEALHAAAGLRAPVDAFFDGVLVMTDNEAVRNNRLSLLRRLADLFQRFADFSKLAV